MRPIADSGDPFARAVAQVQQALPRPEFSLQEAPAPQRLAPAALALTVESVEDVAPAASGRFVLLHDPDGVDEWEGTFRAVVFARADLDAELVDDPVLLDVAWSWVEEVTAPLHVGHVGGTVTRSVGRSFGTMSDRPTEGTIELRASWTPLEDDRGTVDSLGAHVQAWLDLVGQLAGLPPLPAGVVPVTRRR